MIATRSLQSIAQRFLDAFHEDPGHSDLDREQPINITVSLGDLRDLRWALSASSERKDTVEVPRKVADHLYGSSLEVGGKCRVCAEFRELVNARWPDRPVTLLAKEGKP